MTVSRVPPIARRDPGSDPYAWMRHPDIDFLDAERAYYDAQVAPFASLTEQIVTELRRRTPDDDRGAAWEHGGESYYTCTPSGNELSQLRRVRDERVLLDLHEFGVDYAATGVEEISPDGALLAYSLDHTGGERFELRFRDLASGADLDVRVPDTYYSGAWAGDTFFYTVADHANRPHEVHAVDITTGAARVVLTEPDEHFHLGIERSRSGKYVLITAQSRTTSEQWVIPTDDPRATPRSLRSREHGVEYYAEYDAARNRWLFVTNEAEVEFMIAGDDGLALARPGERIHDVLAFADCLVTYQRVDGQGCVRILEPNGETRFEFGPDEPGGSIRLGRNEDASASFVTVVTESFTTPPAWWDIDLATGSRTLRHRQEVPAHEPTRYVSEMIGKVVVVRRSDTALDGSAPCLLWGYGSYESVDDPWFWPAILPLLDRGMVFAKAHIRGGGEYGRQQWIDGHLLAKRKTFTDFIDAANDLQRYVGPIVSRGLSAGGLLQGAVYFMAPERWAGVVAEVPFVDVITSMSDPDLPLTVGEWEEWGDPRIPEQRAYMESYTPYLNLPDVERRPPLLVTGSLHDPRVLVHEPAKWVAALRHSDPQRGHRDDPTAPGSVLFRVETGEGAHTGPAGRYAALAYEAEIAAWILRASCTPPGGSAAPPAG